MTFGETLKRLRLENGLTQTQLGERVGVSHVYISSLERGVKPAPRHAIVVSLAATLGVDAEILWATAQAEREERLRSRVRGEPTSLRLPRRDPQDTSPQSTHHLSPSEEALVRKLRSTASDRQDRERLVETLNTLLDLLRD